MSKTTDAGARQERTPIAGEKDKKVKEKIKKIIAPQKSTCAAQNGGDQHRENQIPDRMLYPKLQGKFEREVLRRGEVHRLEYEDLWRLEDGVFEREFRQAFFDKSKWHQKIVEVISARLAARRP